MLTTIICFVVSYVLLLIIRPFCFVLDCLIRTAQIVVNFWKILAAALKDERLLGRFRTPVKNESGEMLKSCRFRQLFESFADLEDRTKGIRRISQSSCLKWFGEAGLTEGVFSKSSMAVCFTKISGSRNSLDMKGFGEFINLLCEKSRDWSSTDVLRYLLSRELPNRKDQSTDQKKSSKKRENQNSEFSDSESLDQHMDTKNSTEELWDTIYFYLHQVGFSSVDGVRVSKRLILHWFQKAGILGKLISLSRFLQCYQDIAMKHPVMNSNEVGMLISRVARQLSVTPDAIMTMLLDSIKANFEVTEDISDDGDSGPRHTPQEDRGSLNNANNSGLMYFPFPHSEQTPFKRISTKARTFAFMFKKFSKINNPRSTGLLISKWNVLLWFQEAGLLTEISPTHVLECFHHVAQKDTVVNREGFEEIVDLISFKYSRKDLLRSLLSCGKPDNRTAKQKINELMSRCVREAHPVPGIGQTMGTF